MRSLGGWQRTALILVGCVAGLVLAFDLLSSSVVWCDGAYRRFQIPDDYNGSGCSRIIGEWHAVWPWNWDRQELVCLGLCPSEIPLWSPAD